MCEYIIFTEGQVTAMHTVTVHIGNKKTQLNAQNGQLLSEVLISEGIPHAHPCLCRGVCGKCTVTVNEKKELSCRYAVNSDITVVINEAAAYENQKAPEFASDSCIAVLDIGTTTLEAVLVNEEDGRVSDSIKRLNPQKIYGADVISRIAYCNENGVSSIRNVLLDEVNSMLGLLLGKKKAEKLLVTGNTTMLHIFFGKDCSKMGISPYTPEFLDAQLVAGEEAGIINAHIVESMPCISAFVGADIVSGINFAGLPVEGKYNLLLDLGTNAETVLYSADKAFCTAAAAGPCFEGVNISCGMTASAGAINEFSFENGYKTIADAPPIGLCATGLVDVIAELVKNDIVVSDGSLSLGKYEIAEGVTLLQEDVRNFQLAKSAVYSAIRSLIAAAGISMRDIASVFITGGFAGKLNTDNAVIAGLLPVELRGKFRLATNSALSGAVMYARGERHIEKLLPSAVCLDLAEDKLFKENFVRNMNFSYR